MPHVDANGVGHHYRWDGPEGGPVVMLSNSLASDLTMWEPQMPALTGAGYRVLRYDSRGHGDTAVPDGPYTMELLAADVVGLMDALDLERVHFCGLSKGGMIGQTLGAVHGNRMRSLTLCDTAAIREVPWNDRIASARAGGMEAVVDGTLEIWITPEGRARMTEWMEHGRAMILNTPVEGFCASIAAVRDMDQRESIRAITTPTHVIVGEKDFGTTVEDARMIHERIAGSRLTIVPKAAHLSNVDQPEAFNEALLGFLKANG